jgi:hypothetical protein
MKQEIKSKKIEPIQIMVVVFAGLCWIDKEAIANFTSEQNKYIN